MRLVVPVVPTVLALAAGLTTGPWALVLLAGALATALGTGVLWWWAAHRARQRTRCLEQRLADDAVALAARVREAEVLKDRLVAVISHEFRTPLTAIIGLSQTLSARLEGLDADAVATFLGTINDQARRLNRIVHNVLAVAGEIEIDRSAVTDVAQIVREVAAALDEEPGGALAIHVDVSGPMHAAVSAEAGRQIVTNLLENACKFATAGTIVGVRGLQAGGEVVLEISNAGAPLPPAVRQRIFDPFFQADSSDSRRVGGVGLGLHVVRELVSAHGGRIGVRYEAGRLVFVCVFRVGHATAGGPPAAGSTTSTVHALPGDTPPAGRRRRHPAAPE